MPTEEIENAIELPRTLLNTNAEIYVVDDTTLRRHKVQVIQLTEENAIVRGIPDQTKVVVEPIPGAFEGMIVQPY